MNGNVARDKPLCSHWCFIWIIIAMFIRFKLLWQCYKRTPIWIQ